ncbi:MAG: adenylate/guanylate cyclase domain-containing protein [Gammaproteobacteria bacterium]
MAKDRLSGKLAVILHADVAGSTQLVQQDEHLAHERIQDAFRRFSDTIGKYHGRVQELRGDALLAEFDRPSDAVSATLSFQSNHSKYLSSLEGDLKPEIRVGIAMGEVVVADNTVTGAGVVLAQRVEQLANPGGLCISSAVQESLSKRLPVEFNNLGEQTLKGFDNPVKVFSVKLKSGETVSPPQSRSQIRLHQNFRKQYGLVIVVLIIIGVSIYLAYKGGQQEYPTSMDQMSLPIPDKPSIAVLPFANNSNDPDQEYLSDGISGDIITDLSKIKGLTVIARNSSFNFRDKTTTVQEIGKNLGVNYILGGSVQKSGNRLRVTAQLVDAKTGHQLWAERFDHGLTDIFLLQDEITREIISALSIRLSVDEQKHLGGNVPTSFEAYDLFLRGQQVSVDFSEEAIAQAVELYRQAIRLDPNYAHAHGALALARIRQFFMGFTDTPVRMRDRALELARKAADMDPGSHQIQWSLGYIHMYRKEFDEALQAAESAVSLSPNYADGYALLALVKNNLGQADEVIPLIEKAMVLNPHYTWDYIYQLGRAYYALGEYEKAVPYLRQALERNESAGYPRLFLAASYVNLGQVDEAEWEITQAQMAHPEYTYAHLHKTAPIGNKKLLDRFFSDLRTAGLTE